MKVERFCVGCGALLIRVCHRGNQPPAVRCESCRAKRRRHLARTEAPAPRWQDCVYCGAPFARPRLGGRQCYCTPDCRRAAENERRKRPAEEHAAPPSAKGVDYLEMAETQLYPGRGYHTLTREERAAVYERAQGMMLRAIADGTYIDPMVRAHAYDDARNRAERAVA